MNQIPIMKTHTPSHQSGNPTVSSSLRPTALDTLLNAPNPADIALVPSSLTSGALSTLPVTLPPFAQAKKPRNGKIARLPKPVREVVNRMLALNMPQDRIVDAVNELGIQVTQSN